MYLCLAFEKELSFEMKQGEVAEWSIAAVLKTVELRGSRGSNPCLSATQKGICVNNFFSGCSSARLEYASGGIEMNLNK